MLTASDTCKVQGHPIPADVLGELHESTFHPESAAALRAQLQQDGYLLLRAAIDAETIAAARQEVFQRLVEVGEIQPPAIEGIATGTSRRREVAGDLGRFWQSVSEGPALRRASHGPRATEIMAALLGEPARPHDYIFLRPGVVGRATRLHYDFPFFARGSNRILTVWTALGDVPVSDGPLVVVENSQHFDDLIRTAVSSA